MAEGAVRDTRHIWLWLESSPIYRTICAGVISRLNLSPPLGRRLRSEPMFDGLIAGDKLLELLLQLTVLRLKQLQMAFEDLQVSLQLRVLRINLRVVSADPFKLCRQTLQEVICLSHAVHRVVDASLQASDVLLQETHLVGEVRQVDGDQSEVILQDILV